jgi:hypothetical protein
MDTRIFDFEGGKDRLSTFTAFTEYEKKIISIPKVHFFYFFIIFFLISSACAGMYARHYICTEERACNTLGVDITLLFVHLQLKVKETKREV